MPKTYLVCFGRSDITPKEPVPLGVVTMGDWAIVFSPNELFNTLSVSIEEASPYAMTMTLGYTNGANGYIPSAFVKTLDEAKKH